MPCPACGEYRCPGTCRGIPVAWGCYSDPYVYVGDLGPGGATTRRYGQTMNDGGLPLSGTHWHKDMGALGDCARIGHGGGLGQVEEDIPPGGVEDQPCPPGWPAGIPCVLPPTFPGAPTTPGTPQLPSVVVTEEQARQREREAFERGQRAERSNLIVYTAIGSVVSGLVGVAIGRIFG